MHSFIAYISWLGVGSHEAYLIYFGVSPCGDFISVASLSYLEKTILQQTSPFCDVPWAMGVGSVLQMYHLEMGASQAAALYVLASWGFCKRISFGERWELRLSVGVRMGIYQLVITLVWESGSSRFSKIHDLTGHSGWLGYSTGHGSLLPSGP